MRRSPRKVPFALTVLSCLLVAAWRPARAQQNDRQHDSTEARLSPAAQGAVDLYNAPGTKRMNGAFDVPASSVVSGDVAVLNGPLTIAGRIEGSVVAINADVRLAPGARIDHRLVVVGGSVVGADGAQIDGETLKQVELLRYHLDGDRLVAEREPEYDDTWWRRHHVLNDLRHGEAYTDFFYVASRAYDRVEGWAFVVGPRFQRFTDWGKVNIEAFGVVRSARPLQWGEQTLGHDVRGELQFGKPIGVAIGARAFDVVDPTESWQMENGEVGLASVVLHRDFRDYYGRHGGEGFVRFLDGKDADLTVSLSDEQWNDERQRDPWTLFRNDDAWRPNPFMDVGDMHLLTTRLRIDTREHEGSPWSGWYLTGEIETGSGELARIGSPLNVDPATGTLLPTTFEHVDYTRGLFDLRRYNRIAPSMSLNLRLVAGGWLGGDELPTERKFSLGGPGTLPGYGFREAGMTPDVLQCSNGIAQSGTPAQCDRIALVQVELRSRFFAGSLRDDASDDWWRPGLNGRMEWVLFADMGRGWLVGPQDNGSSYPSGLLPPLASFKTDVGLGIDFSGLGVYAAKAVSDGAEPPRFIVRLARRF
jgi:hypothetical protein